MEAVYQKKTQVSAAVTDDTYNQVLKEAARRGVTVSELVRHYVEEGLSNPTPREIRRLSDRLTTIEGALKELYEMAVMNWGQVQKEVPKPFPLMPLPWTLEALESWKTQLSERGLVNEKTGKLAYEELRHETKDAPDFDSIWEAEEEETQNMLREMWKEEGCWTDEEEKRYQEKKRQMAAIKQESLREGAGLPPEKRPYNRQKKRRRPKKR